MAIDDFQTVKFSASVEKWLAGQLKEMGGTDRHCFVGEAIKQYAGTPPGQNYIRLALARADKPFVGYPQQPVNWLAPYLVGCHVTSMREVIKVHGMEYTSANRMRVTKLLYAAGWEYDAVDKRWRVPCAGADLSHARMKQDALTEGRERYNELMEWLLANYPQVYTQLILTTFKESSPAVIDYRAAMQID